MKQDMIKNYLKLFPIFLLLITVIFVDHAFAQDTGWYFDIQLSIG